MSGSVTADIIVIGAGPAGCTFATRMAQLGFDVCLIERARFPRPRLGESLSPGVLPMLATVGSAPAIEACGFPRVQSVAVNWYGTEVVRHDPHQQGMLVDRGAFDAALLRFAEAAGVRLLQPATVQSYSATDRGWRVAVHADSGPVSVDAAFLADATGRARRLGGTRRQVGQPTIAVHGYWVGSQLPERPRIEAGEREWYWGVPIPDGSYNALVFVDRNRFREDPRVSLDDRLRALLDRSDLMNEMRDGRLRAPARAADATPFVDEQCVTTRLIRLGDAALALDPLSSSGVQKAIQTALSGAIVVNTLMRRPRWHEPAIRFYRDSVHHAAARHHRWAMGHYATARRTDRFWADRAGGAAPSDPAGDVTRVPVSSDAPLQLSMAARWEQVPCLGERFVEVRTALRHPALDGAIAFAGGYEIAPLLRDLRGELTLRQIADAWSDRVPRGAAVSIARWLAEKGVLAARTRG